MSIARALGDRGVRPGALAAIAAALTVATPLALVLLMGLALGIERDAERVTIAVTASTAAAREQATGRVLGALAAQGGRIQVSRVADAEVAALLPVQPGTRPAPALLDLRLPEGALRLRARQAIGQVPEARWVEARLSSAASARVRMAAAIALLAAIGGAVAAGLAACSAPALREPLALLRDLGASEDRMVTALLRPRLRDALAGAAAGLLLAFLALALLAPAIGAGVGAWAWIMLADALVTGALAGGVALGARRLVRIAR